MISVRGYVVVAVCGLLLFTYIARKILRRELRAEYALFWGGLGVVTLVLAMWRGSIDILARALGIDYGPALLILFGGVFGIVYLVHLSDRVTALREQTKRLTQELAILRLEVTGGAGEGLAVREAEGGGEGAAARAGEGAAARAGEGAAARAGEGARRRLSDVVE